MPGRPGGQKDMNKRLWMSGAVLALLVVAMAAAGWLVLRLDAPGPLAEDTAVILPRGAHLRQAATILEDAGAIDSARLFVLAARLRGEDRRLKAGEFLIPAGASINRVLAILRAGRTVLRRLTVPEGLTVAQVIDLLEAETALTGTVTRTPEEGSLLPETYYFSYGDDRQALLDRMMEAMDRTLDALWQTRKPDLPYVSARDGVILASIIEKETALPEERSRIAGVFINRLRRGMRLQSDPTVAYGLGDGRPLGRALTRTDLDIPTPYNTYLIAGLPPTPIANPGRQALIAAFQPLDTDELYFVADGRGGHAFARTLEEHQRNVRRWRALRAAPAQPTQ